MKKTNWQGEYLSSYGWTTSTSLGVSLAVDTSEEFWVGAYGDGRYSDRTPITVWHHQSPLGIFKQVAERDLGFRDTRPLLDHAVSGDNIVVMTRRPSDIYSVDPTSLVWSDPAENPDNCYVDPLVCGSGNCFAWDPWLRCLRVSIDDGKSWSAAPADVPGGGADWMAFGNERLLSSGAAGVFISADLGASWLPLSQPQTQGHIRDLQFSSGLFYLLTADAVLTSIDGEAWVEVYHSDDDELAALFFAPELYVRTGGADPKLLAISNGAVQGDPVYANAIAHGNGTWLAVGRRGQIWRSQDRVSWEHSFAQTTADLDGVDYVAGAFVAVSYEGGTFSRSVDGIAWTANEPVCYRDLAYANERFAAVRSDGLVRVWSTSLVADPAYGNVGIGAFAVTAFAGKFVVGRTDGAVMVSSDGLTWSAHAHLNTPVRVLCASEDELLAIGDDHALASSDATTWTAVVGNLPAEIGQCAHGAGRFVVTSPDGVSASADGRSWESQPVALAGSTWPLAFTDDRFILAADGLFTSSDATEWTPTGQLAWGAKLIAGGGDVLVVGPYHYNLLNAAGFSNSWWMQSPIAGGRFVDEQWVLLREDGALYLVPRASREPPIP